MSTVSVRAVLADDERLLREQLKTRLSEVWPDLVIVGEARDGREAVELVAQTRPDLVFLDIRMPLLTGIEAARQITQIEDLPCEIVFVTAYDQYAVEAFDQGAIDYVLKPAETERLTRTMTRVQTRLAGRSAPPGDPTSPMVDRSLPVSMSTRLAQIEHLLQAGSVRAPSTLRWLQATQGNTLKLIGVEDVLFFRSDEKYTRIQTAQAEWLIRTPLRDLTTQLDSSQFWQVHRSTIVNAKAIERVERDESGRLRIHLRGHAEILEVSRSFSHLFRQT